MTINAHWGVRGTLLVLTMLSQTAMAQGLVDGTNVDGVVRGAREYGSATLASQTDGNPLIIGRIDGIPYSVRFRNCTDHRACEDMNLRVGFLIKPTPETVNAWNRDKRFSKAYLDAEGDVILEMDVILQGGVSPENISEVFSYWRLTLDQFTDYIGFN